jgi:c-di-GMP-binding flagellar brake protein YcgR
LASSSPPPSGVHPDRRKYRRIRAPLLCRPTGAPSPSKLQTVDVSLGGLRIYSDASMRVGSYVELDFVVPDMPPVTCTAEVMWVEELTAGASARFEMGLRFLPLDHEALKLLLHVLGSENESEPQ